MKKYLIGIDEAGRGPIAGPVAVGVVMVAEDQLRAVTKAFKDIRGKDSKKLSEIQRNHWFEQIQRIQEEGILQYTGVLTGARIIDEKGIVPAIRLGIARGLRRLGVDPEHSVVKLDGGLKSPKKFIHQETIIKGDEKELAIGLASIVAKVTRDRKMIRLDREYPKYGFAKHKGYGTKEHHAAIDRHGICNQHRKSFLRSG